MTAKVIIRYVVVLIVTIIFGLFLKHATCDDESRYRLQKWQSHFRDRFIPSLTEIRLVRFENGNSSHHQPFSADPGMIEYARARIVQPRDVKDIFELGMRLRAIKGYLEATQDNPFLPYKSTANSTEYGSVYEMLEKENLGWALKRKQYPSLFDLRKTFKPGKCIVIPTGKQYFRFAVHIIRSVREVYSSQIPILVYYLGDQDLCQEHVEYLWKVHSVQAIDITKVFDNSILQLKGWDIKPFAMLAAPFEEVLLMDADSVLMQPPENFFMDEGYVRDGALFFHDRTLFPTDHHKRDWVTGLFGSLLSDRLKSLRYYQMKTTYEQESGVVVINKKRHFAALLSVCRLNTPPERETVIHLETHGDKETFWIGFELVGSPYSFSPQMPGSLGRIQPDFETFEPAICGKLLHFDRNGSLFWFNDSIADSKSDEEWMASISELTHYAMEGQWTGYCCLHAPQVALDDSQLDRLKKLTAVYDPYPLKKNNKTG